MEALELTAALAIPAAVRTPPPGGTDVHLIVSTSLQSWVTEKRGPKISVNGAIGGYPRRSNAVQEHAYAPARVSNRDACRVKSLFYT